MTVFCRVSVVLAATACATLAMAQGGPANLDDLQRQIDQARENKSARLQGSRSSKGASPASKARRPALVTAAIDGDVDQIRKLLAKGADVEAKDQDGSTPLMGAAGAARLDAAKALLAAGANLEARNAKGETPLMAAAATGDEAIVKLLVDRGADVHAQSVAGLTAALAARKFGNTTISTLLGDTEVLAKAVAAQKEAAITDTKMKAMSAFADNHYADAAAAYRHLVELAPEDAFAWRFLGESLMKSGRPDDAKPALQRAVALSGADVEAARRSQALLDELDNDVPFSGDCRLLKLDGAPWPVGEYRIHFDVLRHDRVAMKSNNSTETTTYVSGERSNLKNGDYIDVQLVAVSKDAIRINGVRHFPATNSANNFESSIDRSSGVYVSRSLASVSTVVEGACVVSNPSP